MLTRRTDELNNLKADHDSLIQRLNATVQAKVEAQSLLDEIQTKKIELDFKCVQFYLCKVVQTYWNYNKYCYIYREKNLDSERESFVKQINFLKDEVIKYSEEMEKLRRERTTLRINFDTQLQEKDEEVSTVYENLICL